MSSPVLRLGPGLLVLAAAAALFACGLPGGFVLDDTANLYSLDRIGDSAVRAALYLADAPTGFPGRPLSYLTFLAQRTSWPGDPQAFKIVNIALHLLNGVLVYGVVAALMRLSGARHVAATALIAAGIWLIHPIQLSTVLYVVQRMAELAAFFTLCGCLAYLKGRALAAQGRLRAGYAWMSAAIALGTPLAVLAKESGALLPLFVVVAEFTLLASSARPPRWKAWAAVFLAAPSLALIAYLLFAPGMMAGYAGRSFTLAERLYTEPGILWEYILKFLMPRPRAFGIYFDDYPVAASPWVSLSTAAAITAWFAAFAAAIGWRRNLPFAAFAILWFLAGHLLESTVVPLELYFEHRNYLPLVGPAVFVGWGATRLWDTASSPSTRRMYAALASAAVLVLASVTWVEARTWSDPIRQTVTWATEHPASQRAQYELGTAYAIAGHFAEANQTFQRAQAYAPDEAQFPLSRLFLGCVADRLPLPSQSEVAGTLSRAPIGPGVMNVLDTLIDQVERGTCRSVDASHALALVDAFLSNPKARGGFRRIGLHDKARLHAVLGDLDGAVRAMEAADEIAPSLASVQLRAMWLLSADLPQEALLAIEKARGDPRWRPWEKALYARFFDGWERQVRDAAREKGIQLREAT